MVKYGDQYVTLYGANAPTRWCTAQVNASKWGFRSNAEKVANEVSGRVVRLNCKPYDPEQKP